MVMRKYETKKVTYDREELVELSCDLCGRVAKGGDWETSTWEVAEVEVKVEVRQKDGDTVPEGGWGTEYAVDMCPECFKSKLVPWLESQGCKARRQEWSW